MPNFLSGIYLLFIIIMFLFQYTCTNNSSMFQDKGGFDDGSSQACYPPKYSRVITNDK